MMVIRTLRGFRVGLVALTLTTAVFLAASLPRYLTMDPARSLVPGVLPGGVVVLGVTPVSSTGFVSAVGNTVLAVLWLGTGVAGWRAARQRRFADHRAWMIRNVALTFSIVVNRAWIGVYAVLLSVLTPDAAGIAASAGAASVWTSWVVNLLVAEWWLLRRPERRAVGSRDEVAPVAPAGSPSS